MAKDKRGKNHERDVNPLDGHGCNQERLASNYLNRKAAEDSRTPKTSVISTVPDLPQGFGVRLSSAAFALTWCPTVLIAPVFSFQHSEFFRHFHPDLVIFL